MNAPAASDPRRDWKARAAVLAAALWWGSLGTVGFLVVPLLFANLPSAALAGNVAGKLFAAEAWVAVGSALVLLLASRAAQRSSLQWRGGALLFVIAGLLLALLVELAVAPRILARENLRLWHGVGSAMYLLQWLCAGVVLWKVTSPEPPG
ncbi:DUF4149 domain-containing protein [Ramlibacter sp.]|uniref:DUF4149 domain-containing protein n=1 Tax=Ramlibacter sp. TaxID=1917967 RepID=UPI002C5E4B80|nr:DUF4149 domain-containing protein [Ramlibacter sp.]HWI82426.1 DUF4149 domain-containing protein [Ramlibacter sp.]